MKAYVHDEKTDGKLAELCLTAGIEVLTYEEVKKRKQMPTGYNIFLDQVDVLIMEITRPTQNIHFILAQAILARKPTLCLYGKNQPPRELLQFIKQKEAPRPMKTYSYTEMTLSNAVESFIRLNDPDAAEKEDIPSVKFTIRFTPRNERYLTWYSEKYGITKADYIRDLINREAQEDKDYPENLD